LSLLKELKHYKKPIIFRKGCEHHLRHQSDQSLIELSKIQVVFQLPLALASGQACQQNLGALAQCSAKAGISCDAIVHALKCVAIEAWQIEKAKIKIPS